MRGKLTTTNSQKEEKTNPHRPAPPHSTASNHSTKQPSKPKPQNEKPPDYNRPAHREAAPKTAKKSKRQSSMHKQQQRNPISKQPSATD